VREIGKKESSDSYCFVAFYADYDTFDTIGDDKQGKLRDNN
jgi:hypothetical protein